MHKNLYQESAAALKIAFQNANWWPIVQDEVKERLDALLENLELLGPPFRDAYVAHFKFENMVRLLNGHTSEINKPGALFGAAMSDECYQCGKKAAKSLLDLNDWTEPNEADVQCCISICNHMDKLDTMLAEQPTGVFESLLTVDDSDPPVDNSTN